MNAARLRVLGTAALLVWTAACGGSSDTGAPAATKAPATNATAAAAAPAPALAPPADPANPCTFITTADLNSLLGSSLEDGSKKADDARQIVQCTWNQQPYGTVSIGVSQTPGADAYQTNWDLAPAYFDGDPEAITIAGAEKAYRVKRKDNESFVIGQLIKGRFVLLQIGYVSSANAEKAQRVAEKIASRL